MNGVDKVIHAKVSVHTMRVKTGTSEITISGSDGQAKLPHIIKKFAKKADFPSLGNPYCLYVDMNENRSYLWDENGLHYIAIASDWHDIEVINGGEA